MIVTVVMNALTCLLLENLILQLLKLLKLVQSDLLFQEGLRVSPHGRRLTAVLLELLELHLIVATVHLHRQQLLQSVEIDLVPSIGHALLLLEAHHRPVVVPLLCAGHECVGPGLKMLRWTSSTLVVIKLLEVELRVSPFAGGIHVPPATASCDICTAVVDARLLLVSEKAGQVEVARKVGLLVVHRPRRRCSRGAVVVVVVVAGTRDGITGHKIHPALYACIGFIGPVHLIARIPD